MRILTTTFLLAALALGMLTACGERATRCTPFHKGFPLCGL